MTLRGFNCEFNTFCLLCMRTMLERDRNLLVDARKQLVDKIEDLLNEHAHTGCPCIAKAAERERRKR